MKLSAARQLATSHGLALTEHRYPDNRAVKNAMLLWMIHYGDREVGHWVPATKCYRVLGVCGGPAKLPDVLAALGAVLEQRRATA